jgi:hypothetical protein
MKTITTLFTALLISYGSFGQHDEISIESHQNFRFGTPVSFGSFDSDLVPLIDGSDQSGTKFSIGLNYTRKLKNDWFVRFRPGLSFDSRKDDILQAHDDEFGYEKYEATVDMDLKHTTLNLFAGAGKNFRLSERFSLMVGMDLGLTTDLTNEYGYVVNAEYHYEESDFYTVLDIEYQREFAKYTRIGIVPIIAPKFQINKSFSISAELQYFGALSLTNGEEHYVYNELYQEFNPHLMTEYGLETDVHFNSKASMFSISKLSPLLRFTYEF